MEKSGDFGATKCHLQFLYGSFWIGIDNSLTFVAVDKRWSSTALVVSEARIFCHKVVEPVVDRLNQISAPTKCVADVSGPSAHVIVLVLLVVSDCSKLGFTYHGW